MPPKKKVVSEPLLVVPPIVLPIQPAILVARSIPLQQLVQILLNGARNPMFTVHAGLIRVIWNAYERRDTEAFLLAVQRYLEQAVSHVAQAGKPEEIEGRMKDLTELVEQAGLEPVAKRILSVAYSTL